MESADAGWPLTITGRWPVDLAAAEVQASREQLMLELLLLESRRPVLRTQARPDPVPLQLDPAPLRSGSTLVPIQRLPPFPPCS
jgi:hypothetical protein